MHLKLPYDSAKPISGEAVIDIDRPIQDVFDFIGTNFFANYPKWAVEVVNFEALDGMQVFVGAKAKQIRVEHGEEIESVFTITDFSPHTSLVFQGISAPYKHTYLLETQQPSVSTRVTFRFELLELEIFMRAFQKLIRTAIEEGAENTLANIKNLLPA